MVRDRDRANDARSAGKEFTFVAQPGRQSEQIYRAGVAGDELAREVFQRMGTDLAIGLASLVKILIRK